MSNVEIIQHSLWKYAAEGTIEPLNGLGMKIHIPQAPLDTIMKHSHPILTPYDLRLIFLQYPSNIYMQALLKYLELDNRNRTSFQYPLVLEVWKNGQSSVSIYYQKI
jgi:hypothetical protein